LKKVLALDLFSAQKKWLESDLEEQRTALVMEQEYEQDMRCIEKTNPMLAKAIRRQRFICPILLEPIPPNDFILAACKEHAFNKEVFAEWKNLSTSCPNCRGALTETEMQRYIKILKANIKRSMDRVQDAFHFLQEIELLNAMTECLPNWEMVQQRLCTLVSLFRY
jgi:hypothetical protein